MRHDEPGPERTPLSARGSEDVREERDAKGQIASPGSLEHLLDTVGNSLLVEALVGMPMEGLGAVVAGDVGGALAGLSGASLPSNAAMRRALDDARIEWGHPALANLESAAGGRPLPADQLARFNAAFQHDFSRVRVHTDDRAAHAAEQLHAHAFALGADVFFGAGTWALGSAETDRLLAHELTHVVQHDQGRLGGGGGVSQPSDPTEREAYANEDRITYHLGAVDTSLAETTGASAAGVVDLIGRSRGWGLPDAVANRVYTALGEEAPTVDEGAISVSEQFDLAASELGADAWRAPAAPTTEATVQRKAHAPAHPEPHAPDAGDAKTKRTWSPGDLVLVDHPGKPVPGIVVDPFLGGHHREHARHEEHERGKAHGKGGRGHHAEANRPVPVRTIGPNSQQHTVKPEKLQALASVSELPLSRVIAPGALVWAEITAGFWAPGIVFGRVPAGRLVQLVGPSGAVETLPDAHLSLTPRKTTARFAPGQIVDVTVAGGEPVRGNIIGVQPDPASSQAAADGPSRGDGFLYRILGMPPKRQVLGPVPADQLEAAAPTEQDRPETAAERRARLAEERRRKAEEKKKKAEEERKKAEKAAKKAEKEKKAADEDAKAKKANGKEKAAKDDSKGDAKKKKSNKNQQKIDELKDREHYLKEQIAWYDNLLWWNQHDQDEENRTIKHRQDELARDQKELAARKKLVQHRAAAARASKKAPPSVEQDNPVHHLEFELNYVPILIAREQGKEADLTAEAARLHGEQQPDQDELQKVQQQIQELQAQQHGGGGGGPPPKPNRPAMARKAAPLLAAQYAKYKLDLKKKQKDIDRREKKTKKIDKDLKSAIKSEAAAKKAWQNAEAQVKATRNKVASRKAELRQANTKAQQDGKKPVPLSADHLLAALEHQLAVARRTARVAKVRYQKRVKARKDLEAAKKKQDAELKTRQDDLDDYKDYGRTFAEDIKLLQAGFPGFQMILDHYTKNPVHVKLIPLKPGETEDIKGLDQKAIKAALDEKKAKEKAAAEAKEKKAKGQKVAADQRAADFKKKLAHAEANRAKDEKAADAKKKAALARQKAEEEKNKTPAERKAEIDKANAEKKKKDDAKAKQKADDEAALIEKIAEAKAGDPSKTQQAIAALAKAHHTTPAHLEHVFQSKMVSTQKKLATLKGKKITDPGEMAKTLKLPRSQIDAYMIEQKRKALEAKAARYFHKPGPDAVKLLWHSVGNRGIPVTVMPGQALPASQMLDHLANLPPGLVPPGLRSLAADARQGQAADEKKMAAQWKADPDAKAAYLAEKNKKVATAQKREEKYAKKAAIAKRLHCDVKQADMQLATVKRAYGCSDEQAEQMILWGPRKGLKTKPDAQLQKLEARARTAKPGSPEQQQALDQIRKQYDPNAVIGQTLRSPNQDPDKIVSGPVANDALQERYAQIMKLPKEQRWRAMQQAADQSGMDITKMWVAVQNRDTKNKALQSYTKATTDPMLSPDERKEQLEKLAKERGLTADQMKARMAKLQERTRKLLDDASLVGREGLEKQLYDAKGKWDNRKEVELRDALRKGNRVAQLRKDLTDPKLSPADRLAKQKQLAAAAGVPLSNLQVVDASDQWKQKKETWAKQLGKKDPEEAAEWVRKETKHYNLQSPDQLFQHIRYSDSKEFAGVKSHLLEWDASQADQQNAGYLKKAGVDNPTQLKKVPSSKAELEEMVKEDPKNAEALKKAYKEYGKGRDDFLKKLGKNGADSSKTRDAFLALPEAQRAALLRENPIGPDGKPLLVSLKDMPKLETKKGKKTITTDLLAQATAYNKALDIYDPRRDAKLRAQAKRLDDAVAISDTAGQKLGLPRDEAVAQVNALADELHISAQQALQVLAGDPVTGPDGEALPVPKPAKTKRRLTPELMQDEMKLIQTLSPDERVQALLTLRSQCVVDKDTLLGALYFVPKGGDPTKNFALKTQLARIQAMPDGPAKDKAMLHMHDLTGMSPRQMVDAVHAVTEENDAVAKMNSIRNLPEKKRDEAMKELAAKTGKSVEELKNLYSRDMKEIAARVDPEMLAKLDDISQNGTASPSDIQARVEELAQTSHLPVAQLKLLVQQRRSTAFANYMSGKLAGQKKALWQQAYDKGMTPEQYADMLARTPASMLDGAAQDLKKALGKAGYEPKFSADDRKAALAAGVLADPTDPNYRGLRDQLRDQLTGDHDDDKILNLLSSMTPAQRALFARQWKDMQAEAAKAGGKLPDLHDTFTNALQGSSEDQGLALLKDAEKYDPKKAMQNAFQVVDDSAKSPYAKARKKLTQQLMSGEKANKEEIQKEFKKMSVAERAKFFDDYKKLLVGAKDRTNAGTIDAEQVPLPLADALKGDPVATQFLKDAQALKPYNLGEKWRKQATDVQAKYTASKRLQAQLNLPDLAQARMRIEMTQDQSGLSPDNAVNLILGLPVKPEKKPSPYEKEFLGDMETNTKNARRKAGKPEVLKVPPGYDPNRPDTKSAAEAKVDPNKVDDAYKKLDKWLTDQPEGEMGLLIHAGHDHRGQIFQMFDNLTPAELARIDKRMGNRLRHLIETKINNWCWGKGDLLAKLNEAQNFKPGGREKDYREMIGQVGQLDPSAHVDVNTPAGFAQRMAWIKTLPMDERIKQINDMQAQRRAAKGGADPKTVTQAMLYGPRGPSKDGTFGKAMMDEIQRIQKLPWYEQQSAMADLGAIAGADAADGYKAFKDLAGKSIHDLKVATQYQKLLSLPPEQQAEKIDALAKQNGLTRGQLEQLQFRMKEAGNLPDPALTPDQKKRLADIRKLPPGKRAAAMAQMCRDENLQPRDLSLGLSSLIAEDRKNQQTAHLKQERADALLKKVQAGNKDDIRKTIEQYQGKPQQLHDLLSKLTLAERQAFDSALRDAYTSFGRGLVGAGPGSEYYEIDQIVEAGENFKPPPALPDGVTEDQSKELQRIMRLPPKERAEQQAELKGRLNLTAKDWAKLEAHADAEEKMFERNAANEYLAVKTALGDTFVDQKRVQSMIQNMSYDMLLEMDRQSGGKLEGLIEKNLSGAMRGDALLKLKAAHKLATLPPAQRKEKLTAIRVNDKATRIQKLLDQSKDPSFWDSFATGLTGTDSTHEELVATLKDCSPEELKKLNDRFGGNLIQLVQNADNRGKKGNIWGTLAGNAVAILGGGVLLAAKLGNQFGSDSADWISMKNRIQDATRQPGTKPPVDDKKVTDAMNTIQKEVDATFWTNDSAILTALKGLNSAEIAALQDKWSADPNHGPLLAKLKQVMDGDELSKTVAIVKDAQDANAGIDRGAEMHNQAYDLVIKEKVQELKRDPKNRGKPDSELYDMATNDSAALDKAVQEKLTKIQNSAQAIFKAIDGWGNDNDALLDTLVGLSPDEIQMVRLEYRRHYGKDLDTQMHEELKDPLKIHAAFHDLVHHMSFGLIGSGSNEGQDLDLAKRLMDPHQRVKGLREYIGRMSFNAETDDEDKIFATFQNMTPEERTAMCSGPQGDKFMKLLKNQLGENDQKLIDAYTEVDPETGLMLANPAHIAAVKMKEAMHGSGEWWKFSGVGTDEEGFMSEMDKLTPAQVAEAQRYYNKHLAGSGASFQSDILGDFGTSGEDWQVIQAELMGDKATADAHRLKYAAEGWGTDEKMMEDTLKAAAEGRGGRKPDEFAKMKATFNQLYGRQGGPYEAKDGEGALDKMIDDEFSLSGFSTSGERQYFKQLGEKGKAKPEVELLYAMEGFGTDEQRVHKVLESYYGKSPAEREQLSLRFSQISPDGQGLEDWVEGDFGGSDLLDNKLLLMGEPKTPQDYLERARMRYDFERSGTLNKLINPFMDSLELLGAHSYSSQIEKEMGDVQTMFTADGKFVGDMNRLKETNTWLKMDLDGYREVRNTVADYASTAVQIVGAVVCAVVPGLQGGSAAIIANLLIAVAATGAKAVIKGGGYSLEEGAADLGQALVGAATAGMGESLENLGKGMAGKFAAVLFEDGGHQALKTFMEKAMGQALKGGVDSFLNSLLSSEDAMQQGGWAFAKHLMVDTFSGMAKGAGMAVVGEALSRTKMGKTLAAIEDDNADPVKKASALKHLSLKYADNVIKAGADQLLTFQNWQQWADGHGLDGNLLKTVFVDSAKDAAIDVGGARSGAIRAHKRKQAANKLADAEEEVMKLKKAGVPESDQRMMAAVDKVRNAEGALKQILSDETAAHQVAREAREESEDTLDYHKKALADAKKTIEELGQKDPETLTDAEKRRLKVATEQEPELKAQLKELQDDFDAKKAEEDSITRKEEAKKAADEAKHKQTAGAVRRKLDDDLNRPPDANTDKATSTVEDALQTKHMRQNMSDIEQGHAVHEDGDVEDHPDPQRTRNRGGDEPEETDQPEPGGANRSKAPRSKEEMQEQLTKDWQGRKLTSEDVKWILGGSDPAECEARYQQRTEEREYTHRAMQGFRLERYPEALIDAHLVDDPAVREQKMAEVLQHYDKAGQGAASKALEALAGDPKAQMELAHHLAVYDSIQGLDPRSLTDEQVKSLVKAHAALMQSTEDQDTTMLRKVLSEKDAAGLLTEKHGEEAKLGGCIGDSQNTDGLTGRQVVGALGLDYNDTTFVKQKPDGTFEPKDEVLFVETPLTSEMKANAKIIFDPHLRRRIAALAQTDPDAKAVLDRSMDDPIHVRPDGTKDPHNPYKGTGGTAAGDRLPGAHRTVNEEMKLSQRTPLPEGATMQRLGPDGKPIVIARYRKLDEHRGVWDVDPDLPAEERARYQYLVDRAVAKKAASKNPPPSPDDDAPAGQRPPGTPTRGSAEDEPPLTAQDLKQSVPDQEETHAGKVAVAVAAPTGGELTPPALETLASTYETLAAQAKRTGQPAEIRPDLGAPAGADDETRRRVQGQNLDRLLGKLEQMRDAGTYLAPPAGNVHVKLGEVGPLNETQRRRLATLGIEEPEAAGRPRPQGGQETSEERSKKPPAALVAGSDATELNDDDRQRIGQIAALGRQLDAAPEGAERFKLEARFRELVDGMGLTGAGSAQRRTLLRRELEEDDPSLHALQKWAPDTDRDHPPLEEAPREAAINQSVTRMHGLLDRIAEGASGDDVVAAVAQIHNPEEAQRFFTVAKDIYGPEYNREYIMTQLAKRLGPGDYAVAKAYLDGDPVRGAKSALKHAIGDDEFEAQAARAHELGGGVVQRNAQGPVHFLLGVTRYLGRKAIHPRAKRTERILETIGRMDEESRDKLLGQGEGADPEFQKTLRKQVEPFLPKKGSLRQKWDAMMETDPDKRRAGLLAAHFDECLHGTGRRRDFLKRLLIRKRSGLQAGLDAMAGDPRLIHETILAYGAARSAKGENPSFEKSLQMFKDDIGPSKLYHLYDNKLIPGHKKRTAGAQAFAEGMRLKLERAAIDHKHAQLVEKLGKLTHGRPASGAELEGWVETLKGDGPASRQMRSVLQEYGFKEKDEAELATYAKELREKEDWQQAKLAASALIEKRPEAAMELLANPADAERRRALAKRLAAPDLPPGAAEVLTRELHKLDARRELVRTRLEAALRPSGLTIDEALARFGDTKSTKGRRLGLGVNRSHWIDTVLRTGGIEEHQEMFMALQGVGRDEPAVMRVLAGKTPQEMAELRARYKEEFHEDLDERLLDEFSGRHEVDVKIAMRGDPKAMFDPDAPETPYSKGLAEARLDSQMQSMTELYTHERKDLSHYYLDAEEWAQHGMGLRERSGKHLEDTHKQLVDYVETHRELLVDKHNPAAWARFDELVAHHQAATRDYRQFRQDAGRSIKAGIARVGALLAPLAGAHALAANKILVAAGSRGAGSLAEAVVTGGQTKEEWAQRGLGVLIKGGSMGVAEHGLKPLMTLAGLEPEDAESWVHAIESVKGEKAVEVGMSASLNAVSRPEALREESGGEMAKEALGEAAAEVPAMAVESLGKILGPKEGGEAPEATGDAAPDDAVPHPMAKPEDTGLAARIYEKREDLGYDVGAEQGGKRLSGFAEESFERPEEVAGLETLDEQREEKLEAEEKAERPSEAQREEARKEIGRRLGLNDLTLPQAMALRDRIPVEQLVKLGADPHQLMALAAEEDATEKLDSAITDEKDRRAANTLIARLGKQGSPEEAPSASSAAEAVRQYVGVSRPAPGTTSRKAFDQGVARLGREAADLLQRRRSAVGNPDPRVTKALETDTSDLANALAAFRQYQQNVEDLKNASPSKVEYLEAKNRRLLPILEAHGIKVPEGS